MIQRELASLPDALSEWLHYQTHDNRAADPGYRRFLNQLAQPLAARIPAGAEGLDYGAGADSALPALLGEAGLQLRSWDPLYHPDTAALAQRYDYITCTEAAEHFHYPRREFDRIAALLRPGGWLGLMTELWLEQVRFSDWRYRRDPTHACFYTPRTLQWLAEHYAWRLDWHDERVVIFRASVGATADFAD